MCIMQVKIGCGTPQMSGPCSSTSLNKKVLSKDWCTNSLHNCYCPLMKWRDYITNYKKVEPSGSGGLWIINPCLLWFIYYMNA